MSPPVSPRQPLTHRRLEPPRLQWYWLLILPILFIGPSLLPGQRFLPQHPASFPPLSNEDPARALAAAEGANQLASDRLSPIITDWLAARESAAAGVTPFWDPAAGLGAPLAAGSVAGLLYPPNLVNLILPPEFAGAWTALLALFLAGLGMALFLGRIGLAGGPALIGAIALQAGAFALANLHYGVKVDAALYLPWSLWAAEGLARHRPGAGPLLFLATALSFLAGFPPIALFSAAAVLLHASGQSLAHARRRAAFRKSTPTGSSPPTAARATVLSRTPPAAALSRTPAPPPATILSRAAATQAALAPAPATRADRGWGSPALVRCAAWICLGLAGAAVQLIPTAELSLLSTRQGRTHADLLAESLPTATLAGLALPNLFGAPQAAEGNNKNNNNTNSPPLGGLGGGTNNPRAPKNNQANPPTPTIDPVVIWATPGGQIESARRANPIEWNLYVGPIILILALAGILASPTRAAPALLLLLASIGFAQGWPGIRLLYHLPLFNAGAPARALSVAWVAWPWLAALGAQALAVTHLRAIKGALALAVVLAVAGLTLGQHLAESPEKFFDGDWRAATALVHGAALAEVEAVTALPDSAPPIIARLADSAQRLTLLSAGGALAIALGLFLSLRSRNHLLPFLPYLLLLGADGLLTSREHLDPRPLGGPLFPDSHTMSAIEQTARGGRLLRLDESASGIGDVLRLARPNLATAWGIKELLPYVVFPNRRLVEVMTTIDPGSAYRGGASRISRPEVIGHPALDLFAVTCILSTRELRHPRLKQVLAQDEFFVYRRQPPAGLSSLDSAWLVPRAVGASRTVALGLVTSGQLNQLTDHCVVPAKAADEAPVRSATWEAGSLESSRPAPDRMDLKLTAGDGGWLVISEAWYPGWKATVNGADVEVTPANHALMALPVPAGEVVVRLFYEPSSVRLGTVLSALAALFALVHVLRRRRRAVATSRPRP
ncbi:MAG: YfhO family protein [Planctomycetota bacterium]|nr:YfhO family protein [Planctomycetota bacterium]